LKLSTGDPPGAQFACTENGWITSDVTTQWLTTFHTKHEAKQRDESITTAGWAYNPFKKPSSCQSGKREWRDTAVPSSTHYTSLTAIGCGLS
jgi:hypothetical protein